MKVGIFCPHLDILTSQVRFSLSFAEYCLQRDWNTEIIWHNPEYIVASAKEFNLQLDGVVTHDRLYKAFTEDASYLDSFIKRSIMPSYNLFLYVSNGEVPVLKAQQNWLYIDDGERLEKRSVRGASKFNTIHKVICNSQHTKKIVESVWDINSEVIYPPIDTYALKNDGEKEPMILSVGAFDKGYHKHQEILIKTFKNMCDDGLVGWKLVLFGSAGNPQILLGLRELALGYPVELYENVEFRDLASFYHRATFYWQATGYQEETADKVPLSTSLLEAMAAGCIPLVYKTNLVEEVIIDKKNGYCWEDEKQLQKMTVNMVSNPAKEKHLVEQATKVAQLFGKDQFFKHFDTMLV